MFRENTLANYTKEEKGMNLQQLRCVLEIARVGSVTKAAQNLYISQPNLSRTIKELEKELGVSLFRRGAQCM